MCEALFRVWKSAAHFFASRNGHVITSKLDFAAEMFLLFYPQVHLSLSRYPFADPHRASHWIYQNFMLMSWPETTEDTNVVLMTQGFRNDLSFLSRPKNIFLPLWSSWYSLQMTISLKWKKILGSGQKRKVISESLGQEENVGVLRCFRSWHWH